MDVAIVGVWRPNHSEDTASAAKLDLSELPGEIDSITQSAITVGPSPERA
jgi:hypothetical protein